MSPAGSKRWKWWLFWFLTFLPLFLALAALVYQAYSPDRESQYQEHREFQTIDVSMGVTHILTMTVVYPTVIPLEKPNRLGRPLSVWITDSHPGNPPLAYTVSLESFHDGLLFTDKNNVPTVPHTTLVADSMSVASGVWYVHRAPLTDANSIPTAVTIVPHLYTSDGDELNIAAWNSAIQVKLETRWRAFKRHFCDALLWPTVPLFGVVGTLLGLAWQERRSSQTQRDKQIAEHYQRMGDIENLDSQLQTDRRGAVYNYLKLSRKAEDSGDSEATRVLDRMWHQGWRGYVLDEAMEAFARSNDPEAKRLAQIFREKSHLEEQDNGQEEG